VQRFDGAAVAGSINLSHLIKADRSGMHGPLT
jgi:hypothetical protein